MEYKIVDTQHLSTIELIDIMRERIKVFVVEQNCPYQEVDEEDENALHIMLKDQNKLVAYTRIIEREKDISFGRVLVTENIESNNMVNRLFVKQLMKSRSGIKVA